MFFTSPSSNLLFLFHLLLFLIDFDGMICEDEQKVTEDTTKDLGSLFYHPPEITDRGV